jgi:hypothetical protein
MPFQKEKTMTTHKLTLNDDGKQKTCFTVAPNVGAATDKVRQYYKDLGRDVVVELCVPKPAILIVETVAEPEIIELEVIREPVNGKIDETVGF